MQNTSKITIIGASLKKGRHVWRCGLLAGTELERPQPFLTIVGDAQVRNVRACAAHTFRVRYALRIVRELAAVLHVHQRQGKQGTQGKRILALSRVVVACAKRVPKRISLCDAIRPDK